MVGRIDCYLDLASYYSYVGFVYLLGDRDVLAAHSIELDFHPILLGAVNAETGNRPPWMLPAKAKYLTYDSRRARDNVALPDIRFPKDFMPMSKTTLPNRALHYIKRHFPYATFLTAYHYLFHCFWTPPHLNLTVPEVLSKVLSEAPSGFRGAGAGSSQDGPPLFSVAEVEAIMHAAETQEVKDLLTAATQEAVGRGAFGAPWLWARNGAGKEEPFFGSDRFHFLYEFLGLPVQKFALLAPEGRAGEAAAPKL